MSAWGDYSIVWRILPLKDLACAGRLRALVAANLFAGLIDQIKV
jgi:hypothetical protein